MRKSLFLAVSMFTLTTLHGQDHSVESMKEQTENMAPDSAKLALLIRIADYYENTRADSNFKYGLMALDLAKELRNSEQEARCYLIVAGALESTGAYPEALQNFYHALDIDGKMGNSFNLAKDYCSIAILYGQTGHNDSSILYYNKSEEFLTSNKNDWLTTRNDGGLAMSYLNIDQFDSATKYAALTYQLAKKRNDIEELASSWYSYGVIYQKTGPRDIAFRDFKQSIIYAESAKDLYLAAQACIHLALLYQNTDSARQGIFYAGKALEEMKGGYPRLAFQAFQLLSDYYKGFHQFDSAYLYLESSIAVKDRIFNRDSVLAEQRYSDLETLKQQEERQRIQEAKERNRKNIQDSGIALFIPAFFTFVLYMSRRKVSPRWVEVLGTFSILMAFEFIIFLLHPHMEVWVNHNQVYLFGSIVLVATALSPAHHFLDQWVKRHLCNEKSKTAQS